MSELLDDLKTAVDAWRSAKRHPTERIPEDLWQRALRAIPVHGVSAVVAATKFDASRLSSRHRNGDRSSPSNGEAVVPAFSRLELPPPQNCPIAEVETPTGLKLRVFVASRETVGLLSSLCGVRAPQ